MSTRTRHLYRWSAAIALTLPLMATGTCLRVAEQSAVVGLFDAITPQLTAELADRLESYTDLPNTAVGSFRTAVQRGVADAFVSANATQ